MANQTITTDANHDDLTGRSAGQNITILDGATLTIDSMPQHTAMGLMGEVNCTDGTWIIDARFVKEFAYSSGSGTLPIVGDIITDSGGASGKVIRLNSGTATSGIMTVTEQSGTFTATNTLTSGTFNATLDSVKTGFFEYFAELNNNLPTGLATIDFKGEWYEIGVGNGTDSQVFTLPHAGAQVGVWVETGNGTGVFEKWLRIQDSDAFTNYQLGELGQVFKQVLNSSTITFGTSTQGGIVPNGARIRIPNLHLGTALLASPTIEVDIALTPGTSMWEIEFNSSASLTFNKVNSSSMRSQFQGFDTLNLSESTFCINNGLTCNAMVTSTIMTDCIWGDYQEVNTPDEFTVNDTSNVTFSNCKWHIRDNIGTGFQIATSTNVTMNNCYIIYGDKDQSQSNKRASFNNASSITLTNLTLIGPELYLTTGTSNVICTNLRWSANTDGVLRTTAGTDCVNMTSGASNCMVDGLIIIPGGSPPRDEVVGFSDTINCTFRNAGSINNKIDLQNHSDHITFCAGSTTGTRIQRVFFDNQGDQQAFSFANGASNNIVENSSGKYNGQSIVDGVNNSVKGVHFASGDLATASGVDINYALAVGNIFQDLFTSDTTGRLHAIFQPEGNKEDFINISGSTVLYRKDGDLYIRTAGEFIEIESPYEIKGHTGFQNIDYVISGTNTGNLDVEYAIDTGSGFGAYKAATGANLSAESISPTGFRFKWKITANTSNVNNIINGLYVSTTTTLTDQSDNFYDLDVVQITAPSIIENSRVQLYNVTRDNEIDNSLAGASGYSVLVSIEAGVLEVGDTIRLRAAFQSGVTAKEELETVGVLTSTGLSFINTQTDSAVYNEYGVDGSLVTEFTYDSPNLQIDINDADNATVIQRIGAWYYYIITTQVGINELFGCITWESINSIKTSPSVCDLLLDNVKADPLLLTGGRIYPDDGSTIIAPTSNSIQIDYSPVYVTNAEDIWAVDVVNGTFPGGSAASIIKNTPRVIARKSDL